MSVSICEQIIQMFLTSLMHPYLLLPRHRVTLPLQFSFNELWLSLFRNSFGKERKGSWKKCSNIYLSILWQQQNISQISPSFPTVIRERVAVTLGRKKEEDLKLMASLVYKCFLMRMHIEPYKMCTLLHFPKFNEEKSVTILDKVYKYTSPCYYCFWYFIS